MFKAIVIPTVFAGILGAQAANPSSTSAAPSITLQAGPAGAIGPVAIAGAFAGPMSTVTGAPYSAQTSTERVQTLADGNRIDQTTTGSVARDSQGRVHREESLPSLGGSNGEAPHLIFIDDPVAGVHWNLDPQTKTAFKMPFVQMKARNLSTGASMLPALPPPPSPGGDKEWFFTSRTGPTANSIQIASKIADGHDADVSKVDLGMQMMNGVQAQGTRMTRTIPAGSIGNDMPIVITTETWYSPDLKVLVMSKTSDPRMGDTTYELTNIQRSAPPASLFQVPDDYTVQDHPGNMVFHETKKSE